MENIVYMVVYEGQETSSHVAYNHIQAEWLMEDLQKLYPNRKYCIEEREID